MRLLKKIFGAAMLLELDERVDERGSFVKTFNETAAADLGISFQLKESYFSYSKKGVIRGLHFQVPPHQHAKIVFCPVGKIWDVLVDLRRDSPTYGAFYAEILSEENKYAFYIPEGFAHGFASLEENSMTYYLVSSMYHKESDQGILYSSLPISWPVSKPIISSRDASFPQLEDWHSPFLMEK